MTDGQEVQAAAAATGPTTSAIGTTTTRPTRAKRSASKRTGTPNQNGAATATPDPTVNLSLPADVHAYFQAEAEKDERTLAQFLRRTLREVWRERTLQQQPQQQTAAEQRFARQHPDGNLTIRPLEYPQA